MRFYTFEHSLYRMTDNVLTVKYHQFALIRFIAGFSGSIIILWLTTYIQQIKQIVGFLAYIGMITLPIYVLHQKFLLMNNILNVTTTNTIVLSVFAIIDVILCILLYNVLKQNKHVRLLLFGGN
jgi:fucose 4-O-acetylase-like acetyltransferase